MNILIKTSGTIHPGVSGPVVPFRFGLARLIRKTVAVAALVGGIILVKNEPEFLLPLLPVEALIALEFIFWNDSAETRKCPSKQK